MMVDQRNTWWSTARRLAATVICAGALAACVDQSTGPRARSVGVRPGDIGALRPDRMVLQPRGSTTASDQLAQAIPGFGGAFVADGALNVYLTADANTAAGQAAARTAISQFFAAAQRAETPVRFLPAKYSFVQLRAWEAALREVYTRVGVHTAQVDERANRLDITLFNTAGRAALPAEVAARGLPDDAVASRVDSHVVPLTSLSDKIRPAPGGVRITTVFTYNGSQYYYGCTYGFNAQINDGSGTQYMITNAHCVQPLGTFGGLDGAIVAQPDSLNSSQVGSVVANPPAFTGQECAANSACRYSDAVLVQTDPNRFPASSWGIGRIAQTTARGVGPQSVGSTTISGTITLAGPSSIFFVGDTLQKVGATTGWTAGTVSGTCVYHADSSSGSYFGRVCNGVVRTGAYHGDSGSPVFWRSSTGKYYLMGILWGGGWDPGVSTSGPSSEFWFSRWDRIVNDLSPYNSLLVTPSSTGGCVPQPGQQCPQ